MNVTNTDKFIMAMPGILLWLFGIASMFLLLSQQWLAGGITVGIWAALLRLFLRNIPAAPPEVGLATIWGQRKLIVKKEGWRLLAPFFPFNYDVITVKVERINRDFNPTDVRTKEQAEMEIKISVTFTPDKGSGKNLIEYINSGGRPGVEEILEDVTEEAIRQWARDKDWKVVLLAHREVAVLLCEAVAGVEGLIMAKDLVRGNGLVSIPSLGIILNRLNVTSIKPKGKLVEAAEQVAIEQQQRIAEQIEADNLKEGVEKLKAAGLTAKEAAETFQAERGKATIAVNRQEIDIEGLEEASKNLGPGLGVIAAALGRLGKRQQRGRKPPQQRGP